MKTTSLPTVTPTHSHELRTLWHVVKLADHDRVNHYARRSQLTAVLDRWADPRKVVKNLHETVLQKLEAGRHFRLPTMSVTHVLYTSRPNMVPLLVSSLPFLDENAPAVRNERSISGFALANGVTGLVHILTYRCDDPMPCRTPDLQLWGRVHVPGKLPGTSTTLSIAHANRLSTIEGSDPREGIESSPRGGYKATVTLVVSQSLSWRKVRLSYPQS